MTHPYSSRSYAEAFCGTDQTRWAEALKSWVQLRNIPATDHKDAAGLYPFTPLACLAPRERLHDALRGLRVVSMVLVTDALDESGDRLAATFDIARPYKTHHVIAPKEAPVRFSKHHRAEVRKARSFCQTRLIALADHLDEWCALYQTLAVRHSLSGVHAFSRQYFETLAAIPGFTAVAAFVDGRMASCHIWARHGDCAYSHLAASSEEGYRCGASYAVYDHAISLLADCRYIDLGGTPDVGGRPEGLEFFKRGFANESRTSWLCGSIVDRDLYTALCAERGIAPDATSFFPAYRSERVGELSNLDAKGASGCKEMKS